MSNFHILCLHALACCTFVVMCRKVGLVFFGTVDTNNDLRESLGDEGDYQHVVVARDRHSNALS